MKQRLAAAVRLKDGMTVIEIDNTITKQAAIRDGTLFAQELTPEGNILLKRLEEHA